MGIEAQSRAAVRWPQQQTVDLEGHYDVYGDARDGVVSFAMKLNSAPVHAWADPAGKIGAGLGPAGEGAAGYGHGGIGAGMGAAGYGMAGFGAAWMTFATGFLPDGAWSFAIVPISGEGNPASPTSGKTCRVTLAGAPKPPASVAVASWNNGTKTVTLTLGLSPDDEGA